MMRNQHQPMGKTLMSNEGIHPVLRKWSIVGSHRNLMKNVQSISEGNFASCYANNKAEKFKFRRVSQGIDSIAHAQLLKFRKEKQRLEGFLVTLNREKETYKKTESKPEESEDEDNEDDEEEELAGEDSCLNCSEKYNVDEPEKNNLATSDSMIVNVSSDTIKEEKTKEKKTGSGGIA